MDVVDQRRHGGDAAEHGVGPLGVEVVGPGRQGGETLLVGPVEPAIGPFREQGLDTSQVLLRGDAYHRVLRAYLEYLLAADVNWVDDELRRLQEIHDVATLYEMWVFVEAVKSVTRVTSGAVAAPISVPPSVHVDSSGLVVQLMRGRASGLAVEHPQGVTTLYYSRSFGPESPQAGDWNSWSLPLRPDVTIVQTVGSLKRSVVLDAKYRLERVGDVFHDEESDIDRPSPGVGGSSSFRRDDVYKMHTYRDALPSVFAALAVYPGIGEPGRYYEDHDSQGGVGAVPLAPGAHYDPSQLDDFLEQLLGSASET